MSVIDGGEHCGRGSGDRPGRCVAQVLRQRPKGHQRSLPCCRRGHCLFCSHMKDTFMSVYPGVLKKISVMSGEGSLGASLSITSSHVCQLAFVSVVLYAPGTKKLDSCAQKASAACDVVARA